MKIDDKMIEAFKRYRKVQRKGTVNMFDPAVEKLANITAEQHLFIIENYNEFLKQLNLEY